MQRNVLRDFQRVSLVNGQQTRNDAPCMTQEVKRKSLDLFISTTPSSFRSNVSLVLRQILPFGHMLFAAGDSVRNAGPIGHESISINFNE